MAFSHFQLQGKPIQRKAQIPCLSLRRLCSQKHEHFGVANFASVAGHLHMKYKRKPQTFVFYFCKLKMKA